MAPAQSKRRSRKRRQNAAGARASAQAQTQAPVPAVEPSSRAPRRSERTQGVLSTTLTGRTYGDPPPNPFGGVPVSEIAIFAGAVGAFIGLAATAWPALVVGIIVCTLGVCEVTAREHFSGYRSHTALLAAIPAVGIGVALIALFGGSLRRSTLLLVVLPVFGILVWLLRKRFVSARQSRVIRPPGA